MATVTTGNARQSEEQRAVLSTRTSTSDPVWAGEGVALRRPCLGQAQTTSSSDFSPLMTTHQTPATAMAPQGAPRPENGQPSGVVAR